MENWRKYNNDPFQLLCERYNKKIITEEQLFEQWQQNTSAELVQLLEEVGIDWEKEAEKVEDPDYKPPHERKGKLAKGWEKVNDWILQKSIQIVELAKTAGLKALKSIAWLVKKIQSFCKSHPIICKAAVMLLIMVAVFVITAHFNEAQAKLQLKGKILSDDAFNTINGALQEMFKDAESGPQRELLAKTAAELEKMHNATSIHDITKGTTTINKAAHEAIKYIRDTRDLFDQKLGPGEGHKWMDDLQTLGSKITAYFENVAPPSMRPDLKYGFKPR